MKKIVLAMRHSISFAREQGLHPEEKVMFINYIIE